MNSNNYGGLFSLSQWHGDWHFSEQIQFPSQRRKKAALKFKFGWSCGDSIHLSGKQIRSVCVTSKKMTGGFCHLISNTSVWNYSKKTNLIISKDWDNVNIFHFYLRQIYSTVWRSVSINSVWTVPHQNCLIPQRILSY